MHIRKFIQRVIIRRKNRMDIFDHSSQFCGFLEEVLTCASYISILYCFEIGQKIALGKKFING